MKRLALLFVVGLPLAAQARPAAELARINQALEAWLREVEADRPYVLVDRQAGVLRLMHGRALLRVCPLRQDSLGMEPVLRSSLAQRLRRYRPSAPWAGRSAGPFDWEQGLAEEASQTCALYFSGGALVYAAEVWAQTPAPALRVSAEDLRALYNSCAEGTVLVLLPPGWNEEEVDGHP